MRFTILYLLTLISIHLTAQKRLSFPILFWNVENLFDYKDSPNTNDSYFLPNGLKRWTPNRYYAKLKKLSKVLIAANRWEIPNIIGLCEIENDSVIYDLINKTGLWSLNFKYITTHSNDRRGIDIALLYRPHRFKLIKQREIVIDKLPNGKTTRNILYAQGATLSKDTLNIYVLHLPSRYGGRKYSEPNRLYVIDTLLKDITKLQVTSPKAKIIIMGDFNDYPNNASVQKILHHNQAALDNTNSPFFTHIIEHKEDSQIKGTYKYKGNWGILDHLIVNQGLLKTRENTLYTSKEKTFIVTLPFLLIKDDKYGGIKPHRTYNGMHYLSGFSDHLPIVSSFIEVLQD